jgi:tetratricopeptide (TPR) repeat protein
LKCASLDTSNIDLRTTAEKIVTELWFLPLAVDQAGAAITSGLCDIGEYLEMYHQHHQRLLDDSTFEGASNYGKAVYGTWDVSFTEISARADREINSYEAKAAAMAIFILQIFSFFHFQGISEEIFRRAAQNTAGDNDATLGDMPSLKTHSALLESVLQLDVNRVWDPMFFRDGICVLLAFSLIQMSKVGHVYSVHPLVHSWSRDRIKKADNDLMAGYATKLLSQSVSFQFQSQDYAFHRILVPHIKANHQYAIDTGIKKAYNDVEGTNFGWVYYEAGYWKEAEELQGQVMEMTKRLLGAEHPDALTSMNNLASTYMNQGRWKEAEELHVQVMEMRKSLFGAEHPDTMTSMGYLALTYRNQGRWKEAEELHVQVMEMRKRLLGAEHPDTLTSMGNLAFTYHHQGRWREAEELEVQVMDMTKRLLGAEHPDTLRSMNNLALTYQNQERWKEAEELQVQVIEMTKRRLGAAHPHTLISMDNLVIIYRDQERWTEAEELEVQVMEIRKKLDISTR